MEKAEVQIYFNGGGKNWGRGVFFVAHENILKNKV
jgi:hypothetical protein